MALQFLHICLMLRLDILTLLVPSAKHCSVHAVDAVFLASYYHHVSTAVTTIV